MYRIVTTLLSVLLVCACPDATGSGDGTLHVEFTDEQARRIVARSPLPLAPPDETNRFADDENAARFGQQLFFDERLSGPKDVSCATCHRVDHGFSDVTPLSETIAPTRRHTPSLYNLDHQRWFFWDGRADSAWSQVLGPIEDSAEMGNDRTALVRMLTEAADLRQAYEAIFDPLPDVGDIERFPEHARPVAGDEENPVNIAWLAMSPTDQITVNRVFANVGKAIAAYERKLVAAESPFDTFAAAFKAGDEGSGLNALGEAEQRGLQLFVGEANCWFCHTGALFSDREFHNIGLAGTFDLGRRIGVDRLLQSPFNSAGAYSDAPDGDAAQRLARLRLDDELEGQFKTPSLRNVALHPPYMHDGQKATLRDVVQHYNDLDSSPPVGHREDSLIPLDLSDADIDALVAFLESLTAKSVPESWGKPAL